MLEWYTKIENRVLIWAMVTVVAITTNLVMVTVLTTYIISTEMNHQARTARLATTINRVGQDVSRELQFLSDDLEQVKIVNRFPWSRNNMAEFCIEFEKINPGSKCPDVIALSPDFGIALRREQFKLTLPPESDKEDRSDD